MMSYSKNTKLYTIGYTVRTILTFYVTISTVRTDNTYLALNNISLFSLTKKANK